MTGNQKIVTYLRVSTQRQGQSGLGIAAQRQAVNDLAVSRGWECIEEYVEVESGRRNDRPQLKAAMIACKRHGATLAIAKADRLGRRASFVLSLLDDSGVPFVFAEMPDASELEIGIRSIIAQEESRMISERTRSALKVAKARGVKLGGRRTVDQYERAAKVNRGRADAFAASVATILIDVQNAGAKSLREIAAALNARNVGTAQGYNWHPASVKKLKDRLDNSLDARRLPYRR